MNIICWLGNLRLPLKCVTNKEKSVFCMHSSSVLNFINAFSVSFFRLAIRPMLRRFHWAKETVLLCRSMCFECFVYTQMFLCFEFIRHSRNREIWNYIYRIICEIEFFSVLFLPIPLPPSSFLCFFFLLVHNIFE